MDSFSCTSLNTAFYIENGLTEVPEYAAMQHNMMMLFNITMTSLTIRQAAVHFLFFPWIGMGYVRYAYLKAYCQIDHVNC